MNRPITFWKPRAAVASDEACTTILKYSLPPNSTPGPYEAASTGTEIRSYVPSLQFFCMQKLLEFPDQIHALGPARLHYRPPSSPSDHDIIRALIPDYIHRSGETSGDHSFLSKVDPRLWALLIQTISPLPPDFRTYDIPLSDIHVPILQKIPSTPHFTLVTVLELRGARGLDDETVIKLRELHGLGALDVGATVLSSWGIKRLAKTLVKDERDGSLKGPWGLRILSLRDCMNMTDAVLCCLTLFPLLSVIDLRGTRCTTPSASSETPFLPSDNTLLYHPTPLIERLHELARISCLFSHPDPFFLRITTLHHARPANLRISHTALNSKHKNKTMAAKSPHDILAPRDIPEPGPTDPVPVSEENIVAAEELQLLARQRATAAFYSPLPETGLRSGAGRSTDVSPSLKPHAPKGLPRFGEIEPPGSVWLPRVRQAQTPKPASLMLYRAPPPWSTLESQQDVVPVSRGVKKPRLEDTAVQTDEAKKSKKARENMQAILGMVQRRIVPDVGTGRRDRHRVDVSKNPFLRTSAPFADILDPDLVKSTGPTTRKRAVDDLEKEDMFPVGNSTLRLSPPTTTKPLKPISTLPIPRLPPSVVPTPAMSQIPPPTRKSVKDNIQTKLPAIPTARSSHSTKKAEVAAQDELGERSLPKQMDLPPTDADSDIQRNKQVAKVQKKQTRGTLKDFWKNQNSR